MYKRQALLGTLGVVAAGQVTHGLGVALYQGQRGAQVVADIRQNVPVSYTPLDVYKRQVQHPARFSNPPVSYLQSSFTLKV